MTITTTPLELIQYGSGIFGVLAIVIWIFGRGKIAEVIGFFGVALLVIGVVFTVITTLEKFAQRVNAVRAAHIAQCQSDQEAAFLELPPEWQAFYEILNKLTNQGLQEEFTCRFVKSTPPRISVDDYEALIGAKPRRTPAQLVLANSICLRKMVIFDFAEGKPSPEWEKPE